MKISNTSKINRYHNSTITGKSSSIFNINGHIVHWSSIGNRFGSCIKNKKNFFGRSRSRIEFKRRP